MKIYNFSERYSDINQNIPHGKMSALLGLAMKGQTDNISTYLDNGMGVCQFDDIHESEEAKKCLFSMDRQKTADNVARTVVSCFTAALVGSRTNEGTSLWEDLGNQDPNKPINFEKIRVQGRRLNGDVDAPKNQSDIRKDFGVPLPKKTKRFADRYRKSGKQRKVEWVKDENGNDRKITYVIPDVLDKNYWDKQLCETALPKYGVMTYIHEFLKKYPEEFGFKFVESDKFGYPVWEEKEHEVDVDFENSVHNPLGCHLSFNIKTERVKQILKDNNIDGEFSLRKEEINQWDGLDLIISLKKLLFGKKEVLEENDFNRLRNVLGLVIRSHYNPGDNDAIWAGFSNIEARNIGKFLNEIPTLAQTIELENAMMIFGNYWKIVAENKADFEAFKEATEQIDKAELKKAIDAKLAKSKVKTQEKEFDHRQWAIENTSDEDFADIE